jgi:hypothetical protein
MGSQDEVRDELVQRDYALGLLAQVTELKFRLKAADAERGESLSRLQEEMTRAYLAETRVVALEQEIREAASLRRQLTDMRQSATWKVGRLILAPVRIFKRLLRR